MVNTHFVKTALDRGVPVALLTTEKIGEYECHAITQDLTSLGDQCRWRFVVDFQQVKLLSSVGVGLLLNVHKCAGKNKGRVAFVGLDANILKLLQMTRLDKGLPLSVNLGDAIETVR